MALPYEKTDRSDFKTWTLDARANDLQRVTLCSHGVTLNTSLLPLYMHAISSRVNGSHYWVVGGEQSFQNSSGWGYERSLYISIRRHVVTRIVYMDTEV